jgi:hypothetical protein
MDCAASEFYDGESKTYDLAFKSKVGVCGGGWVAVGWGGFGFGRGVQGRCFCVLGLCLLGSAFHARRCASKPAKLAP